MKIFENFPYWQHSSNRRLQVRLCDWLQAGSSTLCLDDAATRKELMLAMFKTVAGAKDGSDNTECMLQSGSSDALCVVVCGVVMIMVTIPMTTIVTIIEVLSVIEDCVASPGK
jgi:hypothetical protein